MARHFVDTSALVKLYRNEPQSAAVRACISPPDALILGGIAFLEFQSALFGLVRQQLLSASDAQQRIALLTLDLQNFELIALTQGLVTSAEQLLTRFAVSEGLRPPDAIQLACALQAHSNSPLDSFLTTDAVLGRCAAASGLTVKP